MTDTPPLVPAGIQHDPDLSALSADDRRRHHTRQLRSVALHQGIDGVNAYKARYPEAASIRIHSAPVAFSRKPKGYPAAISGLVEAWFESDDALGQSNRADVERLNDKLGASFNPANQFSKPLSASMLRKVQHVFAQRGARLDVRQATTMSKVRQAVKAAKAAGGSSAVPLGSWGIRSGDTLAVGGQSFAIEQHNGHECIRLPVNGSRIRLRLDALAEFLSLTGLAPADPGGPPPTLLYKSIVELAPNAKSRVGGDPLADILPENWPQADYAPEQSPGELAPDCPTPTLSERIRAISAARCTAEPPATLGGSDPLADI